MAQKKRVQLIRPETKQTILAAWAEEFKAAGLPSVQEAREKMEALLKTPEQHELQESISSGLAVGHSWTPLAMLENVMDQWNEPTPEELEVILKKIKGLCYELRPIIAEATKKLLKTLIHRLGGRPPKLTTDQYPEVCEEVAGLYAKRVPLQIAFRRVGQRHKVSGRTIERVWRKRPSQE